MNAHVQDGNINMSLKAVGHQTMGHGLLSTNFVFLRPF